MSTSRCGPHQTILDGTKHQGPFGIAREASRGILQRTKYVTNHQGPFEVCPGGPAVKNSPASLQGTQVQSPVQEIPPPGQQPSPRATIPEVRVQLPLMPAMREGAATRSSRATARESPPTSAIRARLQAAAKTLHSQKSKQKIEKETVDANQMSYEHCGQDQV